MGGFWAANRGGVSPKNIRKLEKGFPSARGMFPVGGSGFGEVVRVGREPLGIGNTYRNESQWGEKLQRYGDEHGDRILEKANKIGGLRYSVTVSHKEFYLFAEKSKKNIF